MDKWDEQLSKTRTAERAPHIRSLHSPKFSKQLSNRSAFINASGDADTMASETGQLSSTVVLQLWPGRINAGGTGVPSAAIAAKIVKWYESVDSPSQTFFDSRTATTVFVLKLVSSTL
jgi:hypothetical protein